MQAHTQAHMQAHTAHKQSHLAARWHSTVKGLSDHINEGLSGLSMAGAMAMGKGGPIPSFDLPGSQAHVGAAREAQTTLCWAWNAALLLVERSRHSGCCVQHGSAGQRHFLLL